MDFKTFADIPSPFDRIFKNYHKFNAVQSSLLNVLLHTNKSVVLSAPTGSGKTVAFELAIVRMLLERKDQTPVPTSSSAPKAIYIAPIKALCAERFADWKQRFEAVVGVQCLIITGDSELDELARLRESQLIITTPEKWDSLTRRWRDCNEIINCIRLFLIDEVHLLNEDVRGPVLEAIVSRMHTIARDTMEKQLRFVVASATIPNVADITSWIAACIGNSNNKATNDDCVVQLKFSDSDRPVPLEKHVIGFNSCMRGFKFDMSLNYKLMEILRKYSEHKATLIFCSSRKSAEMAANVLEKSIATYFAMSDQQKANLAQLAQTLHDAKLRKLTANGVAFHHAGMSLSDRNQIEASFRQGNIMVLLCTNTLAMGVNLPAHLVVIKSTEYYHLGKMMEYPESTLLQMIGRAGRPQHDTKGVAVILTHKRNMQKYEVLVDGKMPIESHLHKHLAEHLNSEIALGTINNLEVAMNWMRSTYFYVRSMRNPAHYGLNECMDKDIIENKLEKMCLVQIQDLQNAGLITRNPQNELDVQTTSYGKLMAKYYLCFETMKLFRQIRGDETYTKILDLVVRCREFSEFTLRVNEKRMLNALNETPLRFPRAGRIKTREDKISCLLQAVLGNITIVAPTLAQEALKMIRIADRIAKCLLEYMRLSEHQAHAFHLGRYKALLHTVTIAKCFHAKLWENSEYAAKQLQKIGAVYSSQLVCAGKTTLKSLGATDARTIEAILNKSYPFGDEILQNLQQAFPEYVCSLQLARDSTSMLQIIVRQVNEAFVYRGTNSMITIGDSSNQLLLFIEDLDALLVEYGCFTKTIKLSNPDVEKVYAHVIHATLVGVDVHETLVLKEPAEESVVETKPKKTRKRKQKTVEEPSDNKKSRSKLSNNKIDADLKNESITDQKSSTINLQKFIFSKSKVLNDSTIASISHNTDNANSEDYLNVSNIHKQNNNSKLVQTKLTNFFSQRKHNGNKSILIAPSPLSTQKRDLDAEFDKLKVTYQDNTTETDRDNLLNFTLERATTPDLHQISAFLETQRSEESDGRSPQILNAEKTNSQAAMCAITNGTQISAIFETPKSKVESSHAIAPTNCKINDTQATEISEYFNNNMEPLNLSKNSNIWLVSSRENQANSPAACDHMRNVNSHPEKKLGSGPKTTAENTTKPPNQNSLDLSRKATSKQNMYCWRDESAKDDASVMSVAMTNKSSDSLANSPKNIEHFFMCYKAALAYVRLNGNERTTENFKNIYQRIFHANAAVDFITSKLNNSGISRNESEANVAKLKAISSAGSKEINGKQVRKTEVSVPLNLKRKCPTEKCQEGKENKLPAGLSTAPQLKRLQLQSHLNEPARKSQIYEPQRTATKAEPTKSMKNPFRLQIMNDIKKKRIAAKTINSEVMNTVLNMKCTQVGCFDKNNVRVDCEELEKELELNNATQNSPDMSFEEYCTHFLQSATKK